MVVTGSCEIGSQGFDESSGCVLRREWLRLGVAGMIIDSYPLVN